MDLYTKLPPVLPTVSYDHATIDDLAWTEVSLAQPCRICGAVRECLMRASGDFAHCHQVTSDWPMADGGWLHRLDTVTVRDRPELVTTV